MKNVKWTNINDKKYRRNRNERSKDDKEIYQPEDIKPTKKKLKNPSEHFQDIDVRIINIIRLYFNYIKMIIIF